MYTDKKRIKRCQNFIKQLFADVNPYQISLDYREEQKIKGDEYTYGEIEPISFADMLSIVDPQKNDIFYDLGCGVGKAVFTAALCYPSLDSRGVEVLPPMYQLAQDTKKQFLALAKQDSLFRKESYSIRFINDDFLSASFADANIVFLNATCFKESDWGNMTKKLEQLQPGTRVIVGTRELESDHFELIDSGTFNMSWGPNSTFFYQRLA